LGRLVTGFGKGAVRRRTAIATTIVALIVAGATGYFWLRGNIGIGGHPEPPPVPAELTDPAARKIIEEYRRRVLANPEDSTAWGLLGMAFDAHYESTPAKDCYRRAMSLDAKDPYWPYLLAVKMDRGGGDETEEAVRLYRRAVDSPPQSQAHRTVAILSLADLLTELGRGAEAMPLYEQAYAADSANPWAAYRMGVILSNRGENDRATSILLGLAPSTSARKKSAVAMAELSRRTGKVKDAEGFDYAAGLLPQDDQWDNPFTSPLFQLRRGRRALMDRYVIQEAAQSYRAAVETATALADQYPSVETQMILLRALVNAKEYPAAVAVADDILRDEGGKRLVTAHSFLGLARLGLADRAEAEGRKGETERLLTQAAESLGESVRLKPDYAPGYMYRSKALLRLGKLPEAEAVARAGIECRPEEWEGYLILADVLAAAGRKSEAIRTTEQAVKLAHPNEPRPKQALEQLGKK
jgi:tetratricopeptide (TPR) repeat protein